MKFLTITLFSFIIFFSRQEDYKTYYYRGFNNYQQGNYATAIDNFKKSYRLKPYFKTAYYLAISFGKISDRDSCKTYALIVMQAGNSTGSTYFSDAKKMYDSCNQTADEVIITGSADHGSLCPPVCDVPVLTPLNTAMSNINPPAKIDSL